QAGEWREGLVGGGRGPAPRLDAAARAGGGAGGRAAIHDRAVLDLAASVAFMDRGERPRHRGWRDRVASRVAPGAHRGPPGSELSRTSSVRTGPPRRARRLASVPGVRRADTDAEGRALGGDPPVRDAHRGAGNRDHAPRCPGARAARRRVQPGVEDTLTNPETTSARRDDSRIVAAEA